MKIIDLSVTISSEIKEPLPTRIDYEDHKEGAKKMGSKLFGGASEDVFLEGNGPAGEFLYLTGHAGTHIDAPWHYFPTCEGKPSRTIEEMPLDWFFHDGVVLDFTDKPDGYCFTVADVQENSLLAAIDYTGSQGGGYRSTFRYTLIIRCDAVLPNRLYATPVRLQRACFPAKIKGGSAGFILLRSDDNRLSGSLHVGASAEAANCHWLIDQGIRINKGDGYRFGWGWDIPFCTSTGCLHTASPRLF